MRWIEIPTDEKGQLNRLAEVKRQIEECKDQLYALIAEANILEAGLCKPYGAGEKKGEQRCINPERMDYIEKGAKF